MSNLALLVEQLKKGTWNDSGITYTPMDKPIQVLFDLPEDNTILVGSYLNKYLSEIYIPVFSGLRKLKKRIFEKETYSEIGDIVLDKKEGRIELLDEDLIEEFHGSFEIIDGKVQYTDESDKGTLYNLDSKMQLNEQNKSQFLHAPENPCETPIGIDFNVGDYLTFGPDSNYRITLIDRDTPTYKSERKEMTVDPEKVHQFFGQNKQFSLAGGGNHNVIFAETLVDGYKRKRSSLAVLSYDHKDSERQTAKLTIFPIPDLAHDPSGLYKLAEQAKVEHSKQ